MKENIISKYVNGICFVYLISKTFKFLSDSTRLDMIAYLNNNTLKKIIDKYYMTINLSQYLIFCNIN